MAIQVICPTCGKSFSAPEQFAGREDHCPACRTAVIIRKPEPEFRQLPPEEPPPSMEELQLRMFKSIETISFYVTFIFWLMLAVTIASCFPSLGP